MNEKYNGLVLNTLDEIPSPNANANEIVALVKEKGVISGYKLSNGKIVSKDEGVNMAKQGGIKGVGIASRKGTQYLKSIPDDTQNNNLGNLPTVH